MITPEGRAYCGEQVSLDLHALDEGSAEEVWAPPGEEAVLVLLEGEVEWAGTGAARRSVFQDRASAVYLPAGTAVGVSARTRCELALVATLDAGITEGAHPPMVVGPAEVVVHDRGEPGWQREVHDVVVDAIPAVRLLVGETFTPGGQWSSFPPHKHDGGDGEPALEEVYYFRCDQPDGFGLQGLYSASGEAEAVFVRHGSVVGIPGGYHPVCAAPGTHLYYLWALAGAERRLAMYEDPVHRRLHGA
ncbi:MAG: 5-deoxy-glucuronate isomerase [Acidimicrobiia bacterium]